MQEWVRITSYPNYAVSNEGEVKNINTGCVLRPLTLTKGYLGVRLYHEGNGKTLKIHRLVALAFLSNPDNLPQVNHIDGDKSNNDVTNLEWCSNEYNMRHAADNDLLNKETQFKQKYDPSEFRKCKEEGMTISAIARKFGCKRDTVYRLLRLR
ncbi:HNH homing endonuclease [Klebsiella phage K1-ULIP33]|uniref:HNH homing endonuclease n=1 Tax=Klebsiella phage K1-ULIP33 TaxID=2307015 RepID=A0A4P6D9C1_9CAUD|nr:HNH homing endonuclease [Klebsiella phage K1-ULIP33]